MRKGLFSILIISSLIALAAPTKKQLALLKNDLVAVKASIKSGKNLEQSEEVVRKFLADQVYEDKMTLQLLLCDVLKRAYEVGNEKMYLKQPTDTTCLVKTGKRMFLAYERLDSMEIAMDFARIPASRKRNAEYLLPYRTNIFMGGLYFMHKREWREAWECFDIFLKCANEPLFSGMEIAADDAVTYRVAFLSLEAARRMDSLSYAMRYADKSVMSHHRDRALRTLADMNMKHGNTQELEYYLIMGVRDFPTSDYFFPHLIDLYSKQDRCEEALVVCDSLLQTDSSNVNFHLGRHEVLMQMKRYDEALKAGKKVVESNDSIDTPYYNIGYIYYDKAQKVMKQTGKPYRQRLREAQKYYKYCRPYMERYRVLRPDDKAHWRPILYDVYLNLNMGKEFSEIEAL